MVDEERDVTRPDLDESLGMRVELRPGKHLSQKEEAGLEEADYPQFRRLTFYSVLGGLCPLIPVPFVDDWALGRIHRAMIRELGESRRLHLTEPEVRILAGSAEGRWPGFFGAVFWAIRKVVVKVFKKVFRTVFYFLAVREGVRWASATFDQGYLLNYAARRNAAGLKSPGHTEAQVRAVREALKGTLQEVNDRPVHRAIGRAFRRSGGLLQRAAIQLAGILGRRPERPGQIPEREEPIPVEKEEELIGGLVDRIAQTLWNDRNALDELETTFDRQMARVWPAPAPSGASVRQG